MDYDTACASFNQAIPHDVRCAFLYGTYEIADATQTQGIMHAQQQRCAEILVSLCAWRFAPYHMAVRNTMLSVLSAALMNARHTAIKTYYALAQNSSAVAVIAPPNNTI